MIKKLDTPELNINIVREEGKLVKQEIPKRLNRHNPRRESKEKLNKRYAEYHANLHPGRAAYVILRWHPDYRLFEYLHTTTSKKRAIAYLNDTFGDTKKRVGKIEFERIYQIKKIICY